MKNTILDLGSEWTVCGSPVFLSLLCVVLNKDNLSCMQADLNLGIIVRCFRTVINVFYMLHVDMKNWGLSSENDYMNVGDVFFSISTGAIL